MRLILIRSRWMIGIAPAGAASLAHGTARPLDACERPNQRAALAGREKIAIASQIPKASVGRLLLAERYVVAVAADGVLLPPLSSAVSGAAMSSKPRPSALIP